MDPEEENEGEGSDLDVTAQTTVVGVPMVSAAMHIYEGRQLISGDEFVASSEADASDLETLCFARRRSNTYKTRVLTPTAPRPAGKPVPDFTKRRPRDRDLTTK